MTTMTKLVLLFPVFTLMGCSIVQTVNPIEGVGGLEEICIIEDPAVRQGFLSEYRKSVEAKGIAVKLLENGSSLTDCEWTSTYSARWSWNVSIYMAYAIIRVFHNGQVSGEVLYDATLGGGRVDKYIEADAKIREMVDALFSAI